MRDPESNIIILHPEKKEREYFTRNDLATRLREIGYNGDRWSVLKRYEKLGVLKYPNRYIRTKKGKIYLLTEEDIDWNLKSVTKYKESKRMRRTLLRRARREGIKIYPHWK